MYAENFGSIFSFKLFKFSGCSNQISILEHLKNFLTVVAAVVFVVAVVDVVVLELK